MCVSGCEGRSGCDACCVLIPYYDLNPDHSFGQVHYEGREYPENIEIHTFGVSGNVKIGDDCYVGEDTRIWTAKGIEIKNRRLVSH